MPLPCNRETEVPGATARFPQRDIYSPRTKPRRLDTASPHEAPPATDLESLPIRQLMGIAGVMYEVPLISRCSRSDQGLSAAREEPTETSRVVSVLILNSNSRVEGNTPKRAQHSERPDHFCTLAVVLCNESGWIFKASHLRPAPQERVSTIQSQI